MNQVDVTVEHESTSERTSPDEVSGLLQAIGEIAPRICQRRDEFDRLRRLPDDIFEALADAGLFRLWLPRA